MKTYCVENEVESLKTKQHEGSVYVPLIDFRLAFEGDVTTSSQVDKHSSLDS